MRQNLVQFALTVDRLRWPAIGHNVRVAVRKDDDVTGRDGDAFAVFDSGKTLALNQQVVNDDVTTTSLEVRCEEPRRRGAKAPGRRKLGVVIDRAFKFDHFQDFGKNIHLGFQYRRFPAKRSGRSDKQPRAGWIYCLSWLIKQPNKQ